MHGDIDRRRRCRDRIPAQKQIRLRPGMGSQHRRIREKRLPRHNHLTGEGQREVGNNSFHGDRQSNSGRLAA
jgi:hypothetical protein